MGCGLQLAFLHWELVCYGGAAESEILRCAPPSCAFRFFAGVLGARLGLRACAQASKRKLHKISQRSETMVNGVSHAAIIVSTGLLDPAGAYAFGAYASKRNFKHERQYLYGGAKHLVVVLLPLPPSVFVVFLSEPAEAYFSDAFKNGIMRKSKIRSGAGMQIASIVHMLPSSFQLVLRCSRGPRFFGASSQKHSSMCGSLLYLRS